LFIVAQLQHSRASLLSKETTEAAGRSPIRQATDNCTKMVRVAGDAGSRQLSIAFALQQDYSFITNRYQGPMDIGVDCRAWYRVELALGRNEVEPERIGVVDALPAILVDVLYDGRNAPRLILLKVQS
jgi:hypothetical protein